MTKAILLAQPLLLLALLVLPESGSALQRIPSGMVRVEAGSYRPLHSAGKGALQVKPFAIDTIMVSRASFEQFLRRNPRWSPERVSSAVADSDYLEERNGADAASRPATWVSWHAAQAYCQSRNARLPTTAEWEYVARASETDRAAADHPRFRQRVLELALSADPRSFRVGNGLRNVWGIRDLHGGPFEWTQDFAGPDTGHHSHVHENGRGTCGSGTVDTGDASDYAAFLRDAFRTAASPRTSAGNVAFRCAASL